MPSLKSAGVVVHAVVERWCGCCWIRSKASAMRFDAAVQLPIAAVALIWGSKFDFDTHDQGYYVASVVGQGWLLMV
jgi:hypothetical protein